MKLVPTHPPGRSTRKARAYAAEICQLRAQGYTFEAIRQALADAGVHVSTATVQREAARASRLKTPPALAMPGSATDRPASEPSTPQTVSATCQGAAAPAEAPTGKQVAEAFMRKRITNPLFRAKDRA